MARTEPVDDKTVQIVNNISLSLAATGAARIRTGGRRSDTAGRKLLKAGADQAGCDITTATGDGYVSADVK